MLALLGPGRASAAPGPPSLTGTSPASPGNDNLPLVKGSADTGATVRLYTNATCTSPVAASGSAAQFSFPGLAVSVADNTTTTFWATATDGTGTSSCSTTSVTYQEVSPVSPPARVTFSSDRDGNWEVFAMNADGSNQTQLTFDGPAPDSNYESGISADGSQVVWARDVSGQADIWKMNSDGSGKTQLTTNFSDEEYPDWSPNASKIAFGRGGTGTTFLYAMNADGTGVTQLTSTFGDRYPDWSPDGTKIAFTRISGNQEIFVMNADGTSQVNLTHNAASDQQPAWSPDGSKIAFTSNRSGDWEIWVMNADGTGLTRLTNNATIDDREPAWAPRDKIVFSRVDVGINSDVWEMNPDGTGLVQLTTDPANDLLPDQGGGGDTTAPAPPTLSSTTPSSPANDNAPLVRGTAEAGSTVRLYTNSACTSAVANNGTATVFSSPGITGNVADNTSTTYWATATDAANNTSACSPTPIIYVEDSAPPGAPAITTSPAPDPGTGRTPSWSFTGEPGATFQCELRRDAAVVSAYAPCATPKSYDLTAQPYGTYTFAVRQTDAVGNGPGSEATETYRLVAQGRVLFNSSRDGNWDIYSMDPDGSNVTQFTFDPPGTNNNTPAWSPDGRQVVWIRDTGGNGDIWKMNADGSGQARITNTPLTDERNPDWSPDGTKIAFANPGASNVNIYTIDPNGVALTILTTSADPEQIPSWSPDGSKIAYNRSPGSTSEIFVMNADGSGQTQLTSNSANDGSAAWSPDGTSIAFWSDRTGDFEVFTMASNGTSQTRLTFSVGSDWLPSWSPGSRIVFVSQRSGNMEIWDMNADGSDPVNRTNNSASDGQPDVGGPDLFAAPPTFAGTSPTSPANDNAPLVRGTAEAGSTVELFTNSTCTSPVAGTGSAAAFASPGIAVSVADNTTTTFWARVIDPSLNVSACSSTSVTFVEDSATPGAPAITTSPAPDPGTSRTPSWSFTGEPGATFQCELRRGATIVSGFAPCTSPESYDLTAQPYGTYTFAVRQTDAVGNGPSPEATESYRVVAPGGIVFTSNRDPSYEIYKMDPDGTNVTQLTADTAQFINYEATWSPDGSRVVWTRHDNGTGQSDLWIMNADGSGKTQLTFTANPFREHQPDWSPDGTKIAYFNYGADVNMDVWVINADGTGNTRLTTSAAEDSNPEWSPDGTKITFNSERDGGPEIFTMNANGSGQTQLTNNANNQQDLNPAWSTDGTRIAFTSDRTGNWEIFTMASDGTGQTNVTANSAIGVDPAWTPGSKITFTSYRTGNAEIFEINPDGTGVVQLTSNAANDSDPDRAGADLVTAPPTFSGTTPTSPANNNAPLVRGSAETGSTVDLYSNSTCTSAVAGSGSAATFASPGIAVSVADNTSTTFWGKVTDPSENTSACSPTSATYVEDSAAPGAPAITVFPAPDPGYRSAVSWTFTGEPGASFQCELSMGATVIAPFAPCTSPKAYTLGSGDGTYTFKVRQSDTAGNGPSPVASGEYTLSSASARIVYSSTADGNLDVYTINPEGTGTFQVTNDGGTLQNNQATWSPNRSQVVYANNATGQLELWRINADGTGKVQLSPLPYDDGFPDWSPDGTKIAFYSTRFPSGTGDIYVMNADGTGPVRLTTAPGVDDQPDWSPDGSKILFRSQRDGNAEIYVMNADGSGQIRLTTNASLDSTPQWSPGGSRMAFYSDRDRNDEVYVMNADGSGQTRLTTSATADYYPVWSPDGSQLAFITTRDGNSEIYLMNPDGTAQTRLTNTPAATETDLDWFAASAADITPPAPPSFTGTTPASPANNNTPTLSGTAETGSAVRL